MQPITTFERREIKYILTKEQKSQLLYLIGGRLLVDESGDEGKYRLMSLYYDSPDKDFYREKNMRLAQRKKIRLRRYVGSKAEIQDEDQIFIEIKEHTELINHKRRILLGKKEAFDLLKYGIVPRNMSANSEIIHEILDLRKKYHLQPSALTSYDRQAYLTSKADGNLRITFDYNIGYSIEDLTLDWKKPEKLILDGGREIMEIKIKGEMPLWLQEALDHCAIQQEHFSKYIMAIDLGYAGRLLPSQSISRDFNLQEQRNSAG